MINVSEKIDWAIAWSCNNLARELYGVTKSDELPEGLDEVIIAYIKDALKRIDPATGDFVPPKLDSITYMIVGDKLVEVDK